ncbi:hypothetical protein [Eisenbergiella tayi]|uniref:hypothetical protein n=1 Tax=Eisenbergiella tayi TaxID=1432052 RepID=UPI0008493462|nr:hypothetical protein [Eisenbergiella tayi]ODR36376.1 hypothetical protein BEI60_14150 [Eisenbergiella tayi]
MNRLGIKVFENAWGYEVFVVFMRDISSKRVSVEVYIMSPEGEMSDLMSVKICDFVTKRNCLDFLFSQEGSFTRDDIDNIKCQIASLIKKEKTSFVDTQDKATMQEIYRALTAYIEENAEELTDNPNAQIFIRDNCGYMETKVMNAFVKAYKEELGFSRIEILKRLKIMGVLLPAKDRPYDMPIKIEGRQLKCYRIVMPEKDAAETASEVISIRREELCA